MQEDPPKPDAEVDNPLSEVVNQPEPEVKNPGPLDKHKHHWHRFKAWYGSHKKWSIPATFLLIFIILAAIPFTRYNLAGLVLKKNFTVQVNDLTAHTPVSGATVTIGQVNATTDGSGKATLHGVKVGSKTVVITKKYYHDTSVKVLVGILQEKSVPAVNLIATGRQVKVNVTNLITGKVLGNVSITVSDITAKTDAKGSALLVLPAGKAAQKAKLTLEGYNDASVTIQVSNSSVKENNFKITPVGKVYFLSKLTGQLNIMKANLDGSDAKVVVAATGNEEDSTTALLQSSDGKYVALVAKRSPNDPTAQLYVLAAADDKLLEADNGNALFNIYGWANNTLIYTVAKQDLPVWQNGISKLKAYDATSGGITLLDQSGGSDSDSNIHETYSSVTLSGNQIVYSKYWTGGFNGSEGRQNTIQIISANGQNHKVVATYDSPTYYQPILVPHSPASFYIRLDHYPDEVKYLDYTIGSTPKPVSITSDQLYADNYNYLFSPSGNQTFWSELRNGKNTLLVGDDNGANTTTVANLSDYEAYGWYTDQYLLVSKTGSELYVMGVKGGKAVKISDYQNTGYGYGYAGR